MVGLATCSLATLLSTRNRGSGGGECHEDRGISAEAVEGMEISPQDAVNEEN